jgi:hypothetical protein
VLETPSLIRLPISFCAGVVPEEVELQPLAGSGGRSSTQVPRF